jgi:hypothetical protein
MKDEQTKNNLYCTLGPTPLTLNDSPCASFQAPKRPSIDHSKWYPWLRCERIVETSFSRLCRSSASHAIRRRYPGVEIESPHPCAAPSTSRYRGGDLPLHPECPPFVRCSPEKITQTNCLWGSTFRMRVRILTERADG